MTAAIVTPSCRSSNRGSCGPARHTNSLNVQSLPPATSRPAGRLIALSLTAGGPFRRMFFSIATIPKSPSREPGKLRPSSNAAITLDDPEFQPRREQYHDPPRFNWRQQYQRIQGVLRRRIDSHRLYLPQCRRRLARLRQGRGGLLGQPERQTGRGGSELRAAFLF